MVCSLLQLSQWMKEKYQTATDESYRDLANLQEKLKKHQAFELELKSNNDRLNQLNEVRTWIALEWVLVQIKKILFKEMC